jgi:predicted glycosyltransferase involved in capsule biosynthesis
MPSQVFFMDLRAFVKEHNFKKFGRLLESLKVKEIIRLKIAY